MLFEFCDYIYVKGFWTFFFDDVIITVFIRFRDHGLLKIPTHFIHNLQAQFES